MSFKSTFQEYLAKNYVNYLKFVKVKNCKKSVACHKSLMSNLNSVYQNYIRTSVEINAINLLLACVIIT